MELTHIDLSELTLSAINMRVCVPGYLAFPFRAYTEQGGGRIEAAWQSVASHIQSR